MWLGARRSVVLLMRVYEPDTDERLFREILSEINILKRNILVGRPSDKLIIDILDKITKKIQKRIE